MNEMANYLGTSIETLERIVKKKPYVIEKIKRVATHANIDDSVTHLTLQLRECEGNMVR